MRAPRPAPARASLAGETQLLGSRTLERTNRGWQTTNMVQHVHGVMDPLALQRWTFDDRLTTLARGAPQKAVEVCGRAG